MSRSLDTIHIAGAGVGGLAAAVALQRRGLPVVVHERAAELVPVGAGLSLWPNAVMALRSIGVDVGGLRGAGGLYRWDGRPLAVGDGEAIETRYGAPLVLLHRADLQQALLDSLAPGTTRLGETVDTFLQEDHRVVVRLTDGRSHSGALLIGADGLRSAVRERLLGPESLRDSGLVAHRAVVAFDDPGVAGEFWGAPGVFGVAPLSDGRVYWYATQRSGDERPPAEVFGHWAEPIGDLIAATPHEHVLTHPLHDRPPARRWVDGRVGLLGDAAHPMLPFLGQGACQAIEDAVALAEAIGERGASPQALAAYEHARHKRAAMLVRRSRSAGQVAHVRRAWQRRLRDVVVRRTPVAVRTRQLDAAIGVSHASRA